MNYRTFKRVFAKIRHWPIHPQWLIFRHAETDYRQIGQQVSGRVLDIGCADQYMKKYIEATHEYIGMDYYQTAVHWYETRPQVYGDAQQLPFSDNSMDTVLLLDVLEHLPHPEACLQEIARILKPTGKLILKVPFLYPLHDVPLDFQRWTQYGLQQLAQRYGFTIHQETATGQPLETVALLANIALTKTVLNWIRHKHPALILAVLLPVIILFINLLSWLISHFSLTEEMMPYSYRLILIKN